MTYRPDDVCKSILKVLREGSKDYAGIRQAAAIGSNETVSRHMKHLLKEEYVRDEKKKKGVRMYHDVILTEKGSEIAKLFR